MANGVSRVLRQGRLWRCLGSSVLVLLVVAGCSGPATTTPETTTPTTTTPEVTIRSGMATATEGDELSFTLTVSAPARKNLVVSVDVTESGSMLAPSPPSTVTIAAGATTATLSVPTVNDAEAEPTAP